MIWKQVDSFWRSAIYLFKHSKSWTFEKEFELHSSSILEENENIQKEEKQHR